MVHPPRFAIRRSTAATPRPADVGRRRRRLQALQDFRVELIDEIERVVGLRDESGIELPLLSVERKVHVEEILEGCAVPQHRNDLTSGGNEQGLPGTEIDRGAECGHEGMAFPYDDLDAADRVDRNDLTSGGNEQGLPGTEIDRGAECGHEGMAFPY